MSKKHPPRLVVHDVPVYVGDIQGLPEVIDPGHSSIHILADEQTTKCCGSALNALSWPVPVHWIRMSAGESAKNLETCTAVWQQLADQGADRHSLVINLGGGVVTDLGGFCAATYMRGVRFLHVSTSVLGMVDAAIGGKQGVDLGGLKNYVGLFVDPELVWIDPGFLKTLPERQIRNGLAEVIKHGCIGDPQLLTMLSGRIEDIDWPALLLRSIAVKKQFVEEDPKERGIRAALNFGHTIGHALETFGLEAGYDLLHGEAVALGMILESEISRSLLGFPDEELKILHTCIRNIFPDLRMLPVSSDKLLELIGKDKKRHSGEVHFALITKLGSPITGQNVTPDLIRRLMSDHNIDE